MGGGGVLGVTEGGGIFLVDPGGGALSRSVLPFLVWRRALLELGAPAELLGLGELEVPPPASFIFSRALPFILAVIVSYIAAITIAFIIVTATCLVSMIVSFISVFNVP